MSPQPTVVTEATFEHTYADELSGLYVDQRPVEVDDPTLVRFNHGLAERIGLGDLAALTGYGPAGKATLAQVFSGNEVPDGARPIAQAYAGHQFGSYNPQLGDGRAVVLGELVTAAGDRVDVALKGSGRTPFSRNGDGRAALGPVLREYLMGEAMHALGVPTTRALAAVTTGEQVRREQPETGAVLTRIAASHLRVGTFQYAAATGDRELLQRLAQYALQRHPTSAATPNPMNSRDVATTLLTGAVERQAELLARWMHLGFIHGVMNTDNMTISGETIDYGPCAFMERFDPAAVFSSIDRGGRYAYRNQPGIALWNLARLAEALLTLIVERDADGTASESAQQSAVDTATEILDRFEPAYDAAWLRIGRAKLGAPTADAALVTDYLGLLAERAVDFTLGWRRLIDVADGDDAPLRALLGDGEPVETWLARWYGVIDRSPASIEAMRRHSPLYVPRNHLVEHALAAAINGDLAPFDRLLEAITAPFEERREWADLAEPADPGFTDAYVTFCGT